MNVFIHTACLIFLVFSPSCGHVKIRLHLIQGSQATITCMLVKHWHGWFSRPWKNSVEFYENDVEKASVHHRNCETIDEDFFLSCSKYVRTLTIKNITNYSNTTWYCKRKDERSGDVFIPALVTPTCNVNTKIDYNVSANNLSIDSSVTLAEGDSLRLNCSSEVEKGDNQNINFSWQFYPRETGKSGEEDDVTMETVKQGIFTKPNISRFDAGVYVCIAVYNSTCKSSDTVNVDVLYAPRINLTTTVNEEGMVNISCLIIPGNPFNTTQQGWRHVIDGQVIEEHPAEVDDNFTIYLSRPSVFNDGEYVCYASNGVQDFHGSIVQTRSAIIRSKDARNTNVPEVWKSYLPYVILGTCIVLAVIVILSVFYICKRKRAKETFGNSANYLYKNQTFDPGLVQVFENENYVSAEDDDDIETVKPDVEVIENEFYVSGEDDNNEKTNRPEVEVIENEFYVSGEDDNGDETKPSKIEDLDSVIYVNSESKQGMKTNQPEVEILENEFYVSGD